MMGMQIWEDWEIVFKEAKIGIGTVVVFLIFTLQKRCVLEREKFSKYSYYFTTLEQLILYCNEDEYDLNFQTGVQLI